MEIINPGIMPCGDEGPLCPAFDGPCLPKLVVIICRDVECAII